MRSLVPKLDEPRRESYLRGDSGNRPRKNPLLERVDEGVDQADNGERVRLAKGEAGPGPKSGGSDFRRRRWWRGIRVGRYFFIFQYDCKQAEGDFEGVRDGGVELPSG